MRAFFSTLAALSLIQGSLAVPAPAPSQPEVTPPPSAPIEKRFLRGKLRDGIVSLVNGRNIDLKSAEKAGDTSELKTALVAVEPTTRPTAISDVLSKHSSIWAATPSRTDIFQALATQVASGLGPLDDTALEVLLTGALPIGDNSINNNNPAPPTRIYPKANSKDAPYSLPESTLRKALFIPSTFTFGAKPPVLMVPGSASYGGSVYQSNLRKLLTGVPYADPVWLNVPGALLGDTQHNSEYIAYAINYLSSISNSSREISVITWSQGGLDAQWVFKYWPSAREKVRDFLPVAPDFRGSVLANAVCLSATSNFGLIPCAPAVIQQQATSDFVRKLRSNGGDSAYVPTTSFYSALDEIVQPQQGVTASSYINDARGVGAVNIEVMGACKGYLAGGFYGHASTLLHPLTYALIVDALTHEGPGNIGRIDIKSVCSRLVAEGLDLDDAIGTVALLPAAGVLLLTYPDKRRLEPMLKLYTLGG